MSIAKGINMKNEGEKIVDSVADSVVETIDDEARNRKKVRKKNKRKTVIYLFFYFGVFLIPVVLLVAYLRNGVARRQQEIKKIVYEEDYASIYSEEIRIVFGPDCKVGDKKDITNEGEHCACGYHSDTYIYDEWEITYKDKYGQTFVQTMNNMEGFEEQQIEWMTTQMEEHYKANQLKDYFDQDTLEGIEIKGNGRSYADVFFGNPINGWSTDEDYKELSDADSKERAYKKELVERLSNPDNMISLYELDYSQVYKIYPVRLDIHLQIEDMSISADEVSDYEKAYQEKLDKIAEEILKESENTCHMDMLLSVTYNDSHKNDYGVTIWEKFRCRSLSIAGEKVDMSQEDKEYNQLLLYWYNENIW